MDLRPIRSKRAHAAALKEAESLWNARNDPAMSKALAAGFGADYVVACERDRYAIYPLR